jgi:hypothetical protein
MSHERLTRERDEARADLAKVIAAAEEVIWVDASDSGIMAAAREIDALRQKYGLTRPHEKTNAEVLLEDRAEARAKVERLRAVLNDVLDIGCLRELRERNRARWCSEKYRCAICAARAAFEKKMSFRQQLIDLGACEEGLAWVGERTIEQAVAECERGDWLEWLVVKFGLWTMACHQARRAYAEVYDQARRAYAEAYDQARRAYAEAYAPAWRALVEACAQARRAYAEALRAAMPDLAAQVRAALEAREARREADSAPAGAKE